MKHRRGYTLIEVVAVVLLVAILAAFGVSQSMKPLKMTSETYGIGQVKAGIELALAEAIRRPNSSVTLTVGTNDVRVSRDGTELPQYRQAFPSGITAGSLTLTGQSDGTFTSGGSVSLQSTEFTYTLAIDRTGRVTR